MKDDEKFAEQLAGILDNASMAVYVTDKDTYELLYANEPIRKMSKMGDLAYRKEKCYRYLMHRDSPCPFCKASEMSTEKMKIRDFCLPDSEQVFQLKGKLIDWNGKTVHIEYVDDVTGQRKAEKANAALLDQLGSMVQSMPGGLCMYRFDGQKLFSVIRNEEFYKIFGCSEKNAEKETVFLNVHPEDINELKRKIDAVLKSGGKVRHTYRCFNEQKAKYIWLTIDGRSMPQSDGTAILYTNYVDVTESKEAEERLKNSEQESKRILNAIPGGVAIYKVSDIFETKYFSSGVPEMSGYTTEEYNELIKKDAAEMTYPEDKEKIVSEVREAIEQHKVADFEFRKIHKKGTIMWVQMQAGVIGYEDDCPLLHCVFHDITKRKEAESALIQTSTRLENIVNTIPGGVAIYRLKPKEQEIERVYFSAGIAALAGYTTEEFERGFSKTEVSVAKEDLARVKEKIIATADAGKPTQIAYRLCHKDGSLVWVTMNGQTARAEDGALYLYATISGMSEEAKLYQEIAIHSITGIYVIDKRTHELLFANETMKQFMPDMNYYGKTCYSFLQGYKEVCPFCIPFCGKELGKVHEMYIPKNKRYYAMRAEEIMWRDTPAYVEYISDITEEVHSRKEKEQLLIKYQATVENAPSGIVIMRLDEAMRAVPVFVNEGFLKIVRMTRKQMDAAYGKNVFDAIHPDDYERISASFSALKNPGDRFDNTYRLVCGDGEYVWVQMTSTIVEENGQRMLYAGYLDVTKSIQAQQENAIQKQTMEAAIEHSNLMYWEYRMEDKTVHVGKKVQDIFQSSPVMGGFPESWLENGLIHKEDADVYAEAFRRIDNGSHQEDFDARVLLPASPDWVWHHFRCTAISDEQGKAVKAVCTAENIDSYMVQKRKYEEMIRLYQNNVGENVLLSGYCNMTQNIIQELTDFTGAELESRFGLERDKFVSGVGMLIPNPEEREKYLNMFLSQPLISAFGNGASSHSMRCLIQLDEKAQGKYVHIHADIVPFSGSGELMDFFTITDVTDQVFSEKLIAQTVENNYDYIIAVDLHSKRCFHLVNAKQNDVPARLGMEYDEIVRNFSKKYLESAERKKIIPFSGLEFITEQLKKENSYTFRFSVKENGEVRNKEIQFYYIDQERAQVSIACRDITVAVREQQALLHLLANSVERAGVVNLNGAYTMYAVEAATNNLFPISGDSFDGYVEEMLHIGQSPQQMAETLEVLNVKEIKRRLNEMPEEYSVTYPLREKDSERLKFLKFFWIDDTHRSFGLLRIDITKAEKEQQEKKEALTSALVLANEANRAKSDFLSAMSHDIRTPMNAIIGMTELALSDIQNKDQTLESLNTIKNSSRHLLALINDVLDMGRIESGRMIMAQERFSHYEEHQKVIDRVSVLIKEKNLKFTHTIKVSHDACIGDSLKLYRVVENLIGNAIKFTPKNGSVSLDMTELCYDKPNFGLFQITVSDAGIGMDEETRKHLFEPFYRQEDARVEHIEGTGLGLPIVKGIVDFSGGTIEVQSKLGKGSTFVVQIPFRLALDETEDHASGAAEKVIDTAELNGLSVLLVEDHPINQRVAQLILEKAGMRVTLAGNGKAALDIFKASKDHPFDIILMDIQMPVMNGYEAAEAIRTSGHAEAWKVPIVAMTANAFAEDIKKSLDAGMNAHLAKPIEPKKLYETLLQQLAQKED